LSRLSPHRYEFIKKDITSPEMGEIIKSRKVDTIVNFAAESHVDRSIIDATAFVNTNIVGVQNLITWARKLGNIRFVQVSTDEVYGSLEPHDAPFTEQTPLSPNSPYAASKASADLLCLASFRTHGQPIVITRCSNNYGPYHFPEKLLPLVITNAIEDKTIPVYGDGQQIRDWIFVEDHCSGIAAVMEAGRPGEVYNISSHDERKNREAITIMLGLLNKPTSLMKQVGDRPGHDRRYALNSNKIRTELDWKPKVTLEEGFKRTVEWYQANPDWWKKVKDESFFKYYQANYDDKFKGATV
jgi:dTDP-glucose 4,6-dehydratase